VPSKKPRVPSYRKHSSGQARVTINGKDHLLGPFDSPESRQEYDRLIAEWLSRGRTPEPPPAKESKYPLTVSEVVLAYWKRAREYYGFDRQKRGDEACWKHALRMLRRLYSRKPARGFRPRHLKACRLAMVRKGWSRTYVNAQVNRLRACFRWAAEEEMIPAAVHARLAVVASLRAGKCEARESPGVRPVSREHVEAVLPFLPPPCRAMAELQLLTAARPGEVCRMRGIDLETKGAVWVYRPGSDQGEHGQHKTAHHGKDRVILLGPRAQEVAKPFLLPDLTAYLFSPKASEQRRSEARRAARKTKLWSSHVRHQAKKRKAKRSRPPAEVYTVHAYRQAIKRACDKAFPPPEPLAQRKDETQAQWRSRLTLEQKQEMARWRKEHRFHPHRLRHTAATELRREFGAEAAKIVLGHSTLSATLIYAERDLGKAAEIVSRIG
jgi:integrase